MNKKILFYYTRLGVGGAEKSLIRMMNALSRDGNEITLLTRFGNGESGTLLNPEIHRISLSSCIVDIKKCGILEKSRILIQRLFNTLKLKYSGVKYDLVITGLQGLSPAFVLKNVKADEYMQCIRSDLKQIKAKERVINTLKLYVNRTNAFLCVSKTAQTSLNELLPETASKSFVLYNFLNIKDMHEKCDTADNPFGGDDFRIVSVCRIEDSSKGVFRMLNIAERLVKAGYRFKWFLVGDGPDAERLRTEIKERKAEVFFIMVGRKDNPFPFYKYADLVVVPSYYEGLCGVVNEAKVAGAAVLATEFSGIHEQLTHGENGWIVENNEDSIYIGIQTLMDDKNLLKKISNQDYPIDILDDTRKLSRFYQQLGWK